MLRGSIEMRSGVLDVVATLGAVASHRRGIDLGLTAAVLFWIVVWGGFMVGVGWFVLEVLPRLGRRGARAVQVGVTTAAAAKGQSVGAGYAPAFGQPRTGQWVDAHPLGRCPRSAPRHGSDGLCQYCSWARISGVPGPWGRGMAIVSPAGWDAYIERVLDVTGTPLLDGTRDAWGVPRVMPGELGWEEESSWLAQVEAAGGQVFWPVGG